jgi:hypothetical protein
MTLKQTLLALAGVQGAVPWLHRHYVGYLMFPGLAKNVDDFRELGFDVDSGSDGTDLYIRFVGE